MRSRDEEPKTEAAPVEPTVDPSKPKKSVEERLDALEKKLVPIIGPMED